MEQSASRMNPSRGQRDQARQRMVRPSARTLIISASKRTTGLFSAWNSPAHNGSQSDDLDI